MRTRLLVLLVGVTLAGVPLPQARAEILVTAVVAEVNNQAITLHEVLEVAEVPLAQLHQRYSGAELRQQVQALLRVTVWQLINKALLVEEAERQLTEQEKQQAQLTVDRIVKDMIGAAGSLVNLRRELEQFGLTVEQKKRRETERQMVQMLLDREVRSLARVRADEVRQYYVEHRDEFQQPRKVRIRQILVRFDDYGSKEEAERTAEQVLEKLRGGGDFAYLATVYSHGPYARQGGLWEFMEQGGFLEEVDRVAFSLERGALSDLIETSSGYHIIRVEDIRPARTTPFEEAQREIQEKLYRQRHDERLDQYVKGLQEKARIGTYEQYLEVGLEQVLAGEASFGTSRPVERATPSPPAIELER